jgi:hypothetical protein
VNVLTGGHELCNEGQDVEMCNIPQRGGGEKERRSDETNRPGRNFKSEVHPESQIQPELSRSTASQGTVLTRMVSPRDVLDKLLNMEVTGVTAREMIEVLCDRSTALADLIRVHNVTSANTNAQAHHMQGCLTHSSLLEIPVTIGETTYTAVVDSGSEVNIIRSDIYQHDVRIPIVSEVDMSLRDANSGNNHLLGLVPNFEMKVAALRT